MVSVLAFYLLWQSEFESSFILLNLLKKNENKQKKRLEGGPFFTTSKNASECKNGSGNRLNNFDVKRSLPLSSLLRFRARISSSRFCSDLSSSLLLSVRFLSVFSSPDDATLRLRLRLSDPIFTTVNRPFRNVEF